MARRGKNGDDSVTGEANGLDHEEEEQQPALNSAARAGIIRDACLELDEYDKQIAGIKAEQKAIVETRIVAGLGMKKADFALARKLRALDQGDRDGLFDAIRECFAALGLGEQMNWLDAAEQDGAAAS